ncbi:MAG: hypothetical protein ACRENK_16480 [Gemmatimonadaceae bacterium]
MSTFLGLVTGVVAYGVNYGVEYIPIAPMWRSVTFGVGGLVGSIGLSKWGSPTLGAGFAGGVGALLMGRVVTQVRMAQIAPSSSSQAMPGGASAVYMRNPRARHMVGAGAVYTRDAGAVYQREAGAATTMRRPAFGPSFKDAGASRYVPGPVRFYGPASWAYQADAGRPRYVSAHNQPK